MSPVSHHTQKFVCVSFGIPLKNKERDGSRTDKGVEGETGYWTGYKSMNYVELRTRRTYPTVITWVFEKQNFVYG